MIKNYFFVLLVVVFFILTPAIGQTKENPSQAITLDKSLIQGDLYKPMHIPIVARKKGRAERLLRNLNTPVVIKKDFRILVESVLGRNDANDAATKED